MVRLKGEMSAGLKVELNLSQNAMTDVNILKPDDENEVSIYGVYKD
jgi:hypothetical protein